MNNMVKNTLFITGTDTSVGKTFVCARMLGFLRQRGVRAGYQKWAATGLSEGIPEDLSLCLAAAGIPPAPELIKLQVPFAFKFPASPHLAAEMEGERISARQIMTQYKTLAARYEWLIVEGVGGLLVPLRRDLLLADLLAELKPQTLLVAHSGLGTLNHTFLTLEAMRQREIPVLGVVLSDPETVPDEKLVQDNIRTIAEIGRVRVFGRLRRRENSADEEREFYPIGQAVFEQMCLGK